MIRMPFGKHRGVLVHEIPDEYLDWLISRNLREPVRSAVLAEWQWRFAPSDETTTGTRRMADQIITVGYRALTHEHHPDHGGQTDAMQAVNAAASWLRRAVRMMPA